MRKFIIIAAFIATPAFGQNYYDQSDRDFIRQTQQFHQQQVQNAWQQQENNRVIEQLRSQPPLYGNPYGYR